MISKRHRADLLPLLLRTQDPGSKTKSKMSKQKMSKQKQNQKGNAVVWASPPTK